MINVDIFQPHTCFMCRDLPINPRDPVLTDILIVYTCDSKNHINSIGNLVYTPIKILLGSCEDHISRLEFLKSRLIYTKDVGISQLESWDWTYQE